MSVRIEPASAEDVPHVLGLVERHQMTLEGLREQRAGMIVARNHSGILGTATLESYGDGAVLRSLAVEPAAQRQRIGQRLVEACLEHASRTGVPAVYLLTMTSEPFFERFGFERIAREDVPAGVSRSVQFAYACPRACIVMRRFLRPI
jgi:amino-acid N-acetyltransferase